MTEGSTARRGRLAPRAALSRLRSTQGPFNSIMIGLGLVIANFLLWYAFGLRIALAFWTLVAVGLALVIWLVRTGPTQWGSAVWPPHIAIGDVRRFHADLATRRISDVMTGAQPGRGFSNHQLAKILYDVTAERLVRKHGADPDAPLTTGNKALSKDLARYLATAGADDCPALNRRTLHRHLKEIESL